MQPHHIGRYRVLWPGTVTADGTVLYEIDDPPSARRSIIHTWPVADTDILTIEAVGRRLWALDPERRTLSISSLFDFGSFKTTEGLWMFWAATSLAQGARLSELLHKSPSGLLTEVAIDIIAQLCLAVQFLLDGGLTIYLQPDSILITPENKAIIFPRAVLIPLLRLPQNPSAVSEINALGVIGYLALTGRPPAQRAAEVERALDPYIAEVLRRATDEDPARCFASATEFRSALLHAQTLRRIALESERLLSRARFLMETGPLDAAIEVLDRLLALYPESRDAQNLKAQARQKRHEIGLILHRVQSLINNGHLEQATETLNEVFALDPRSQEALRLLDNVRREQIKGAPQPDEQTADAASETKDFIPPGDFTRLFERGRSATEWSGPPLSSRPSTKAPAAPAARAPTSAAPLPQRRPNRPPFLTRIYSSLRDLMPVLGRSGRTPENRPSPEPDLPEGARIDNVLFSVTAPGNVRPGAQFELQFWAHLEAQRDAVRARALEALRPSERKKMLFTSQGPYAIKRNTLLSVRLILDQMHCSEPDKLFLWTGKIGAAAFVLKVDSGAAIGPHAGRADICVNGVPVARLDFVLHVQKTRRPSVAIPVQFKPYRRAFASYASEDRSLVLARVQGINKVAPQLSVFIDVLSLRSGEYWSERLAEEIPKHDTFFLFWSRYAKASIWVEKEWRCAYNAKGLDFIDPIPLEPPANAAPPPELAAKHFNDPLLAFIKPPYRP